MLLCISNLAELKGSTIPKIVNLFENTFELSFTDNLKVLSPKTSVLNSRELWKLQIPLTRNYLQIIPVAEQKYSKKSSKRGFSKE